jgi:L-iditol 2-dehydrogenase
MVNGAHPATMRAARLHGIRDLRLEQLPRPVPGPGAVLLRVACVGVCGSDVHYYLHGRIGDNRDRPHRHGPRVLCLGGGAGRRRPGFEVGQLVAVEPSIACGACELCEEDISLCLNVRFCGTPPIDGVFSEYTVMPAQNCFPATGLAGGGCCSSRWASASTPSIWGT